MHITASVFINDDEPGLHEDYQAGWLTPQGHQRDEQELADCPAPLDPFTEYL